MSQLYINLRQICLQPILDQPVSDSIALQIKHPECLGSPQAREDAIDALLCYPVVGQGDFFNEGFGEGTDNGREAIVTELIVVEVESFYVAA